MTENRPPDSGRPTPSPLVWLFAATFVAAMFLNMYTHGSDFVTIFLGSAALLVMGVDVGKLTGRQ